MFRIEKQYHNSNATTVYNYKTEQEARHYYKFYVASDSHNFIPVTYRLYRGTELISSYECDEPTIEIK